MDQAGRCVGKQREKGKKGMVERRQVVGQYASLTEHCTWSPQSILSFYSILFLPSLCVCFLLWICAWMLTNFKLDESVSRIRSLCASHWSGNTNLGSSWVQMPPALGDWHLGRSYQRNCASRACYWTELYSVCIYYISGLHFWSGAEQEQVWAVCAVHVCVNALCVYVGGSNSTNFCLCQSVWLVTLAACVYVCAHASVHVSIGNTFSDLLVLFTVNADINNYFDKKQLYVTTPTARFVVGGRTIQWTPDPYTKEPLRR